MDVAQLVRAPVCGSGGRGFKSPHPPQRRPPSCRTGLYATRSHTDARGTPATRSERTICRRWGQCRTRRFRSRSLREHNRSLREHNTSTTEHNRSRTRDRPGPTSCRRCVVGSAGGTASRDHGDRRFSPVLGHAEALASLRLSWPISRRYVLRVRRAATPPPYPFRPRSGFGFCLPAHSARLKSTSALTQRDDLVTSRLLILRSLVPIPVGQRRDTQRYGLLRKPRIEPNGQFSPRHALNIGDDSRLALNR